MKHLLRRLTALLMVMAMVMSFAVTAAAAEEGSTEVSSAASEQEADPNIQAEDLDDIDTSEDASEDASEDESKGADESEDADASTSEDETQTDPADEDGADVSVPAAESSAPAEESQEEQADSEEEAEAEEETEADELSAQQAGGMGWSVSGGSFTLSYSDNGTQTAAKDGFFAVPTEEKVSLGGTTYTFTEGVYEFDADGHLVETTTETVKATVTKKVSVLRKDSTAEKLTLNLKDAADRQMTVNAASVTKTASAGVTTVKPVATLVVGSKDGKFFFEGAPYTGFYRESADALLQGMKDGKVLSDMSNGYNGQFTPTGKMATNKGLTDYVVGTQLQEGNWADNLWYYEGEPYTGYFKADDANNPAITYYIQDGKGGTLRGQMKETAYFSTYIENYVVKKINNLWYVDGVLFTGWYQNPKSKIVYLLKDGDFVTHKGYPTVKDYTGLMAKVTLDGTTYNAYAENGKKMTRLTGLYYQRGLPLTGVPTVKQNNDNLMPKDLYLYKNGKKQNIKDGWYKAARDAKEFWKPNVYYYFKSNKAVVGDLIRLKAIQEGKYKDSHSYYYYFDNNRNSTRYGQLVTNLLRYKPGILKSGKFRIHADHTTYTGTILMRNSKTGKYDIPVKSFVVAMSLSKSATASTGTKYGNYPLARASMHWYEYQSPRTGSWCWYSSKIHIWGSGSMFHSSNYKHFKKSTPAKTRHYKMIAHIYNQIGTACTQHCVRAQTINVRLINELYKASPKFNNHNAKCTRNVRVYLSKSTTNNFMPFGRMTMTNNFDLNGYILQNANAYKQGKDCAFDPTDHECKGATIYITKSGKKKDKENMKAMTKVKMTGYKWYELYYAAV